MAFVCFSCEKSEQEIPLPNQEQTNYSSTVVVNGRLFFTSKSEFESLLQHLKSGGDVVSSTQTKSRNNFVSLKNVSLQDMEDLNARISYMMKNSDILLPIKTKATNEDIKKINEDIRDELVPEEALQRILNKDYELQIENNIYKVTPLGTFITKSKNIEILNQKLENGEIINKILDSDHRDREQIKGQLQYIGDEHKIWEEATNKDILKGKVVQSFSLSNPNTGISSSQDLHNFNDDEVILYDTFRRRYQDFEPIEFPFPDNDRPVLIIDTPPVLNSLFNNDNPTEDDFRTVNFDAKTWAGKKIQSIVGRDKYHRHYFSRNYRAAVNLYAYNYVFTSAIGLKAKCQSRHRFLGVQYWEKTNADEIRLGVRHIKFKVKDNRIKQEVERIRNAIPNAKSFLNNWSNLDYRKDYQNLDKTILMELRKNGYISTEVVSNGYDIRNVLVFNLIDLGVGLDVDIKITDQMIKQVFKTAKGYLEGLNSIQRKNNSITNSSYNGMGIRIFDSEGESTVWYNDLYYSATNVESLNHSFDSDWHIEIAPIEIGRNDTSTTILVKSAMSLLKSLSNKMTREYKIEEADVYGAVKREGIWRAVRIRKDK